MINAMISARMLCYKATTASRSSLFLVKNRSFSGECAPAQRIRSVLEEYRREHFSRELPSRFKKEVVKAMTGTKDGSSIQVDNLNLILHNIGRDDARLSEEELMVLLQEVGATDRCVSVDKIMQLM